MSHQLSSPLSGERIAQKTFRSFKPPLKPPTHVEDSVRVANLPIPSVSQEELSRKKESEHLKLSLPALVEKLPTSVSKKAPRCSVCKALVKGHPGQVGKGKSMNGKSQLSFIEKDPQTSSHEEPLSLGLSETLRSSRR